MPHQPLALHPLAIAFNCHGMSPWRLTIAEGLTGESDGMMLPCRTQLLPSKVNRNRRAALRLTLAAGSGLFAIAALAGRPLTVDDADVEKPGRGHIEAWAARAPGSTVYNLAPAYAPIEGLELGALLARDTSASMTLSGVQAKWLITPKQDNGCNTSGVLGWSHAIGTHNTASLNGLLSCNGVQRGSVHLNLGASKASSTAASLNWGVAYEREVGGVTPSIEWFGNQGAKPTVQAGLRGNIARNLQLDGSIGRRGGATLYSLGTERQF